MNGEGNRPSAETTVALMLGVSNCPKSPHLSDLPGSGKSAESFYSYLTGDFGLPEENIKDLFDSRRSPADQLFDFRLLFRRLGCCRVYGFTRLSCAR